MKKTEWILMAMFALWAGLTVWLMASVPPIQPETIERTIEKRDTVIRYIYSTDTIRTREFTTDTVYITKVINDTVWIADIPRTYTDSTSRYTLDVNAVKMNWYKLRIHAADTVTLYDTKEVIVKRKQPSRWGFGIFAGPSYDVVNNRVGVSVGAGITFRIK